ncbi:hypothetical protein EJB05_20338, partial [Eragrostis curvula]
MPSVRFVEMHGRLLCNLEDNASAKPEEIINYRRLKRAEAEKNLDAYVLIAKRTREDIKIGCEKVIIEMDSVAKGLDELIARHSITKLVMGAAADQHYSKRANENLSTIPASSPRRNAPLPTTHSISKQLKSVELAELEYEASSSNGTSSLLIATAMSDWEYFFGDWGMTVYGSSRADDAISIYGLTTLPATTVDTNELTPIMHSPSHDCDNIYLKSASTCDQEDKPSAEEELYHKPHDPCTNAEILKGEDDEEIDKLRKAEMDLLSALQRIKESEDLYLHEFSERKEIEKTLATQKLEIDEMRRRHCTLYDELQESKKQKLMLEQRITQIKSAAKDYVEEITENFIKQLCKESKTRQRTEMDLLSTTQRVSTLLEESTVKLCLRKHVKEAESSYRHEKARRENLEEKVARQRLEFEEIKRRRDELYYELQDVKEQKLKLERVDASEETNRRRKAERDLISALHRIDELEHRHMQEMKKKEAMEETIARQLKKIEEAKRQLHEVHDKHMIEMKYAVKAHEEKISNSMHLLQELQDKHDKLLQERNIAFTEAEDLRQKYKQKQRAFMTAETLNIEFSFVELQQATKDFNAEFKISEDEFASGYRGFLRNTFVAIKLLHPQSLQGEVEFHQQVAKLAKVRHPNLVTLVGACPEAFALVYEFLPNGSLEDRLLCKKKRIPPLTWKMRTRIIAEICSALAFIHSHKPYPIFHGNLNAGNILLDANFVSKMGNLGIGQSLKQSNITIANMQHHHTNNHRTLRDIDHGEFLITRELKLWSDVYSFGIIILQLLTGSSTEKIVEIVQEAMEKAQLHLIMDASAGDWPFVQAKQLADLGLRCTKLSGREQPDLAGEAWDVIQPLMQAATLTKRASALPSDDSSIPSHFICPIFQEVMSDPHIAADGFTYEAQAIRGWLDSGRDTSPMTNLKLAHRELTPNRALRSAILEWEQQQQEK